MSARDQDFVGTERFELVRRLGEGGMGVVYLAFDRAEKMQVALKTLRALDGQSLYRFKQEFRALADLDHPNLVRLGELVCEEGRWFFTMEHVAGSSWLSYVRPGSDEEQLGSARTLVQLPVDAGVPRGAPGPGPGTCDEARLRRVLPQLALGVATLHEAGKIHRDIKPSNVLVTALGRAVLLDFGLAIDLGQHQTEEGIEGTALYMAPEQAASRPVGPEADWYALGVMLYEALTGRTPFEGGAVEVMMNKQRFEPPPPRALVPDVPRDLDALCTDLLRIDPAGRPRAGEVLARLGVASAPGAAATRTTLSGRQGLLGRDAELRALESALSSARAERCSRLVLVSGASGLGKSALVRCFLGDLEAAQRALVLRSRCYERETVPFKAFDGLIDALSQYLRRLEPAEVAGLLPLDIAVLARVFPVLRRVPAISDSFVARGGLSNLQDLRARAFAALRELLVRVCRDRPVVLSIDDLQWADADSLVLLADVLHPPEAPPVFLVATVRAAEDGPPGALPAPVASAVAGLPGVHQVVLGALAPADATALLERLLVGAGASPDRAGALAAECHGHPLLLQEVVRFLTTVGPRGGGPVRLQEVIWSRVCALEASARAALEVIALAGEPLRPDVVGPAAGLEGERLGRALAVLRVAHLVRSAAGRERDAVEPYHDQVREAVLAHLDAGTCRRLHQALAGALESAGAAAERPETLVLHLEAAGQIERAAELAARAGRRASEALAFDQAADLFRTALRLGQHGEAEARALRCSLGEALVNAGRSVEAAEELLEAAEGAETATRFDCQRRAAEQLLGSGHIERGLRTLETVLHDIGEVLPPTPQRALVSLLWHRARLRLRGVRWREREASQVPPKELIKLDVYNTVAIGMGMADAIRGADFQARGLLLALRTGERWHVARALAIEAIYLGTQGRRTQARARALVAVSRRAAEACADPYLLALVRGAEGIISLYEGNFLQSAGQLLEAETSLREQTVGSFLEQSNARVFRMLALRYLGAYAELRRWLADSVRDAVRRGDLFTETTMKRAFNVVWLVEDQPGEARRMLDQRAWTPPEGGYHIQHWYELLARVELSLYEGRAASASEELGPALAAFDGSLLGRVQMIRTAAAWMRARTLLAEAEAGRDAPRALGTVARIARGLLRERTPYVDVWAEMLQAAVCAQQGQVERALGHLRAASALSESQSRRFYVEVARSRAGELVGGEAGRGEVEAASAWMRAEGIRRPERLIEVVAPGFGRGSQGLG